MKMHNKKRGFTIVELVIVIAVIAILSAVLIPTFAGIVKKSRRSADETAVAQMNTLLAADDEANDLEALKAMLAENGYDLDNLSPLSKDYSFMYSAELDKVFLVEDGIIVYPAKYAGDTIPADAVTLATDKVPAAEVVHVNTQAEIKDVAKDGGVVFVEKAIESNETLVVEKDLVVNLSAKVSSYGITDDAVSDGVFHVVDGATLTLNGDGEVNGLTQSGYNMAIWADGGDVVINGGYYTNEGATDPDNSGQQDLIYAKNGAKITINGGKFKCETPAWTLNCKNDSASLIIIKGGEFFDFDPSNLPSDVENDTGILLADGYEVVTEVRDGGTWYKVVKSAE